MTPTICFMPSETKYVFPITEGSRPNQLLHRLSLMRTTRSSSSGTGRRPSCGRTPSVGNMSMVGQAIETRSTRASVRSVEVPAPKLNTPSSSFERSLY